MKKVNISCSSERGQYEIRELENLHWRTTERVKKWRYTHLKASAWSWAENEMVDWDSVLRVLRPLMFPLLYLQKTGRGYILYRDALWPWKSLAQKMVRWGSKMKNVKINSSYWILRFSLLLQLSCGMLVSQFVTPERGLMHSVGKLPMQEKKNTYINIWKSFNKAWKSCQCT